MQLYYHQTDGGAEYYSTSFNMCPNGEKDGTTRDTIMRTDGDEIEIYLKALEKQGISLKITV